jgi:hypothetical protein
VSSVLKRLNGNQLTTQLEGLCVFHPELQPFCVQISGPRAEYYLDASRPQLLRGLDTIGNAWDGPGRSYGDTFAELLSEVHSSVRAALREPPFSLTYEVDFGEHSVLTRLPGQRGAAAAEQPAQAWHVDHLGGGSVVVVIYTGSATTTASTRVYAGPYDDGAALETARTPEERLAWARTWGEVDQHADMPVAAYFDAVATLSLRSREELDAGAVCAHLRVGDMAILHGSVVHSGPGLLQGQQRAVLFLSYTRRGAARYDPDFQPTPPVVALEAGSAALIEARFADYPQHAAAARVAPEYVDLAAVARLPGDAETRLAALRLAMQL